MASMVTLEGIDENADLATGSGASRRRCRDVDTSAGKALALLDAFSGQLAVLGVTALAERAEMPKSTAHRLLSVLMARGYVRRVGDRYCLTEHLFEMGNQVPSCRPYGIRELAAPYLGELFAETRQTVQLAVLSGTDMLYLDKVAGRNAVRYSGKVGSRMPVYATAVGKAVLAFSDTQALQENLQVRFRRLTPHTHATPAGMLRELEQVQQDGVATDHEELRLGISCVAAPIVDSRTGRAVAAISLCSSNSSVAQRYSRALVRATRELSALTLCSSG